MASVLERMAGTPREITLRGKTYQASPIRVGDIAAFRQFLRKEAIRPVLELASQHFSGLAREVEQLLGKIDRSGSPESQDNAVEDVLGAIRHLQATLGKQAERERQEIYARFMFQSLDREFERSELSAPRGTIFLLWRAIQRLMPEVTLDEVSGLIGLDNLAEVERELGKLLHQEGGRQAESDPHGSQKTGDASSSSSPSDTATDPAKSPT